jgi:hypothetical protein
MCTFRGPLHLINERPIAGGMNAVLWCKSHSLDSKLLYDMGEKDPDTKLVSKRIIRLGLHSLLTSLVTGVFIQQDCATNVCAALQSFQNIGDVPSTSKSSSP